MGNPFDDTEGTFHVLVNAKGEYSLWPDFAEVPRGWETRLTSVGRAEADAFVEDAWTTLDPRSIALRNAKDAEGGEGAESTGPTPVSVTLPGPG
jgi:MbtH protein